MKKLLFTGSNGFLGKNIIPLLHKIGYNIITLSRSESLICCDLSNEVPSLSNSFDIVIHAAGKAHSVPKSNLEIKSFFDVNLQGTINLCRGLEKSGIPKSFIFISSVAVYGSDFGENISENHPLKGKTPYARSKIKAEHYLSEWSQKNDVILSVIRPPLISGPNPPGNLGVMINGIKTGKYFSISKGKAKKSVLMVQDIANLIPLLAEKGGIYNVCDSEHLTFRDLEIIIARQLGRNLPLSIPIKIAKILALVGDLIGGWSPINSNKLRKITKSLTFSNEKAKKDLDWKPINVIKNFKIH